MMVCFSVSLHAAVPTLKEFVKLSSHEKLIFLQNEVEERTDGPNIQAYFAKKRELMPILFKGAEEVAKVWLDTILEGDYALTEQEVTVRVVALLHLRGEVYGLQVMAAQSAIQTGSDDCHYVERKDQWFGDGCLFGAITQVFYTDLNGEWLESVDYPEFND